MWEEVEEASFLFDWEVLLDFTITLPNQQKTRAFFSRVYISDNDLLNRGSDDKYEMDVVTNALKKMKVSDAMIKRNFLKKVSALGFVHGFRHSSDADSSDFFVNVKYKSYKSSFPQNVLPVGQTISDSESSRPTPSSSSFEEDLDDSVLYDLQSDSNNDGFDFGFDERRDAKLVAKNANKLMKNDREIMKYWFQRYRLFSKLNDGILMDREGWFSVTPERLAQHIADRIVTRERMVVLDAFTGVGGNAIQFALRGAFVIAIDIDPIRLRCAAQNAKVYGVEDRINFICTDFFHFARSVKTHRRRQFANGGAGDTAGESDSASVESGIDAVFLSPPWGGPSYLKVRKFDLDHLCPNGVDVFRTAEEISPNICYFLPRNTSVRQLILLSNGNDNVEIEQGMLNMKVKALSVYYGNLAAKE